MLQYLGPKLEPVMAVLSEALMLSIILLVDLKTTLDSWTVLGSSHRHFPIFVIGNQE
jgi:hypothetical protein